MKRLIVLTLFVLWSMLTGFPAGEVQSQVRFPTPPPFTPPPTPPQPRQFTLNVSVIGNGVVGPIGCDRNCNGNYVEGVRLLLIATPQPNSVFTGWAGACAGIGPCVVTMNRNQAVIANFVRPTLTVSRDGSGTGRVSSNPPGISDCGTDCDEVYPPNLPVTLTAHNGTGVFAGWRGLCTIIRNDCVVFMNGNRNVVATFERPRLRVIAGAGRVTSNTAGINCGNDCEEHYDNGRKVTLEAKPDDGFRFSKWEGDCESESGPFCVVSMDKVEKTVRAVFARRYWTGGIIPVGPPSSVIIVDPKVELIAPQSQTVYPHHLASYEIAIKREGFADTVGLSIASISPTLGTFSGAVLPTATLNPSSTRGNNSTLTITNTITPGEFIVRISATASNLNIAPIDVKLTVQKMVAGARKECTGLEPPVTVTNSLNSLTNKFRLDTTQRVTLLWEPRWISCSNNMSRLPDTYKWSLKKVDSIGQVVLLRLTTTNQQTFMLGPGEWEIHLEDGNTAPGLYRVLIP